MLLITMQRQRVHLRPWTVPNLLDDEENLPRLLDVSSIALQSYRLMEYLGSECRSEMGHSISRSSHLDWKAVDGFRRLIELKKYLFPNIANIT